MRNRMKKKSDNQEAQHMWLSSTYRRNYSALSNPKKREKSTEE